ncbi:MAG TPA: PEP/pyruvate-binding domain-containing protein, partial [Kofleriaceae bacterium]|nr:PEP/pyruvate-binding domain-containing protein [Kofleriaceae bacterium]
VVVVVATMHRGLQDFHHLMRHRIMDILLVASPYDSFVLEEAGQIGERVVGEFRNLDLHYGPGLTTVSTGGEALDVVRQSSRFNLIISGLTLGDMNGAELGRRVKELGLDIPVVLLAFDAREVKTFAAHHDLSDIEKAFLWQGDARILLAIVKYVEDRRNVVHDTQIMGVQVVIVIEDNVRYYSSFLPVIYAELLQHSRRLVSEAVNVSDKIMRMRARPKILLCSSYEEAWDAFVAFQDDVLGVISDIEFPAGGKLVASAGIDFVRAVRVHWPDMPVLLQSSNPAHATAAAGVGATFLLKGSATLLADLRRFMVDYFGFGDFVFRRPSGSMVGMAHDLKSLEEWINAAPADSIAYHAARNHFSSWLKARTEFALADELRPRKVTDFPDPEGVRTWLSQTIARYRRNRSLVRVADFDRTSFDPRHDFHRIGGGSLGGKARGLAFMRMLLGNKPVTDGLDATVTVPAAVVLATDVFDRFIDDNDLRNFAIHSQDGEDIVRRFQGARFPKDVREDLAALLPRLDYPLAVRSSSLLEDSQHQPFAGIYETFMLANRTGSPDERLDQLIRAIVRVYASMFSRHAKDYIAATPYRLEQEKMAVIVQRIVGAPHGSRYYPDLAGAARSHNFYPTPPLISSDGIAAIALGLGRSVAGEGNCLRFCPRYPRHLVQFSSVRDVLANTQRTFWALDLAADADMRESRFDLAAAEADGTLAAVASTYSRENDAIYDGTSRPGVRVVTFASILKHSNFPLATLLDRLLAIGRWGMGGPVEIEFAVDLARRELAFLQLRPLAMSHETLELVIGEVDPATLVCKSDSVLGNGRIDEIRDIIVVDRQRFERASSRQAATELAQLNAELAGRPYLLVGVGRWGSTDPWLGIPVTWEQISGARVIVEAGFADFKVTPSQGTHFFQNLTSFDVGYFTVNPDAGDGFVDWAWLGSQPAMRETAYVRHLRYDSPVVVKMNGKNGEGIILKPNGTRT